MATCSLTRTVMFAASHRYFVPSWSAERNAATFGRCANEHGHGHTYHCAVTVAGTPDPVTGMVVDLGLLDRLLHEEVVQRFDHRYINLEVPEFAFGRTVPTGEMLCMDIWNRVAPRLPAGSRLVAVRVQEEPLLYAEYQGDA